MLRIVADNQDFSTVDRLEFNRVCLNREEEEAIAADLSDGGILLVDERYRPYFTSCDELNEDGRPKLKHFHRGPFTLSVANQGDRMDRSFLIFQLQHAGDPLEDDPSVEKTEAGLYLTSKMHIVTHGIGILPFVDAFRRDILKEADRADRLLKAAKTRDLGEVRAQRDINTVRTMTHNFMSHVHPEQVEAKVTLGKEAISDMLSSALDADAGFYDDFWNKMSEFFEPAIRYVGEEHALGRTDLESPSILHT